MFPWLPDRTTESFAIINNQPWVRYFHWSEAQVSIFFFFFPLLHLPSSTYTCNKTTYSVSWRQACKHSDSFAFVSPSLTHTHTRKHACSHITSSRWLDNLHQFNLAKKQPLVTTILLLTLLARIQWVFSLCLRATDSARRWKLERPSSLLPRSCECRHHSRLLTSVLGYCQKLHIFMQLVMEAGSTVGDGDDMEKEEVKTQRV